VLQQAFAGYQRHKLFGQGFARQGPQARARATAQNNGLDQHKVVGRAAGSAEGVNEGAG